jgi:hypothetical protein
LGLRCTTWWEVKLSGDWRDLKPEVEWLLFKFVVMMQAQNIWAIQDWLFIALRNVKDTKTMPTSAGVTDGIRNYT